MHFQGGHIPVLYDETMSWLKLEPGQIVVDGTLGACGHSRGILERIMPGGMLIGIDKDEAAIARAHELLGEYGESVRIVHSDFKNIIDVLDRVGVPKVDRALLDLGVSSYQLEESERGFSYMQDARLDMRMDQTRGKNALDVVNSYSVDQLARLIREYGEEKWSTRIAQFIVSAREKAPIESTGQLASVIQDAIPASARRSGPHPAKRTFQAIRIEVNDELRGLTEAVSDYVDCLRPAGRLAVITFHSLEDRIVKKEMARLQNPCTCPPDLPVCACGNIPKVRVATRKPVIASNKELDENPRARSAKLRVAERL